MAVRRRPVLVEFTDSYGEKQVIHRGSGSRLAIRRKTDSVSLAMTKTVGKLVGVRVREERIKAGMDMPTLAERAGLKGGKQAIYHIEQALSGGLRLGTLYAIAAALNISPFSLLPQVSVVLAHTGIQLQRQEGLAV